jgi:predicted O-linked N-acetylglucosamine transferase (SPINDLY family)
MKKIKLTQGKFALIDNEDFHYLNQFKWHCSYFGYACRKICYSKKMIWMHREIMKVKSDEYIDHIDCNKLNNCKSNLRIATYSQNHMNSRKRKNTISIYKGVTFDKKRNKWVAQIKLNYKHYTIGYFENEGKAAKAYNVRAYEMFGEYARLNQI